MPRRKRDAGPVTLKALAEHLGLSPSTVSLVMNRSPSARSIPDRTRARIQAAARELNYRPNLLARSLRSKRTHTVGVLMPEISEGYAAGILAGIDRHLLGAGYSFLVACHRNQRPRFREYLEMLRDRLVDGYLIVNTPLDASPPLPAVAISGHRSLAGVTNVAIDHERAAHQALAHLQALGHRRVAFFKGHAKSADTEERWRAIVRAAGALGIPIRSELALQLEGESFGPSFTPEEGYREGYVFGERLLAGGERFTALFAFNDLSAIGAMRALRDAGLRVPDDVSVIGFDDIQSAAFQYPSLTTVRQPLQAMGEMAARLLLERLGGRATPSRVTVEPHLVVRESTASAQSPPRGSRLRALATS